MARRTPRALKPLRHESYRWLFASIVMAMLSAGLLIVGLVWQVVALGGGPTQLSAVTSASAVGMLLTTLLGGALADRVPQKFILMGDAMLQSAAIGAVAILSLAGLLDIWHLTVAALITGLATGLYYPAYSALLPSILPADDLLAANGLEGVLRPMLMQAGGPALASALIAVWSPGLALAAAAAAAFGGGLFVIALPTTSVRRELTDVGTSPVVALLRDVREGFVYMVRTPWLFATLLYASVMILVMMGPFEVLVPFAIKDQAGGGPPEHAYVLAAFGVGSAIGSLVVASFRLPRRYLTVMNLLWGLGCIPLVVFGVSSQVWVMVVAGLVMGAMFQGGMVIWGTLLQRRVPSALLGRVSSLDFFVSLAFMPISMALAGPVSELIGLGTTFLVAGFVPVGLAIITILVARLPADEIAHPLDSVDEGSAELAALQERPD